VNSFNLGDNEKADLDARTPFDNWFETYDMKDEAFWLLSHGCAEHISKDIGIVKV
jgi:hypothetical protein